jgi:DNA-binding transcriptional ArsR family regulator
VAGPVSAEGELGLLDRPSAPLTIANRTHERRVEVIAALRRLRMTATEIADCLDMALSTVSGILTRIGMGRLGRLGLEPAQRASPNWRSSDVRRLPKLDQ